MERSDVQVPRQRYSAARLTKREEAELRRLMSEPHTINVSANVCGKLKNADGRRNERLHLLAWLFGLGEYGENTAEELWVHWFREVRRQNARLKPGSGPQLTSDLRALRKLYSRPDKALEYINTAIEKNWRSVDHCFGADRQDGGRGRVQRQAVYLA